MEHCDFIDLLRQEGRLSDKAPVAAEGFTPTEGTTILALCYRDGVLVAGDRRATMGNVVMYDRADKVLVIDDSAVMALSGSPANAYEIARMLEMSFQYYRRMQLQEMSLEGKLRSLSRLVRENLPMAMQGVGAVVPIFAAFDQRDQKGRIYFYDMLGAQFESADFYTTGSGSPGIRGALYHQNRWGAPLVEMDGDQVLRLAVRMLETAAEFDTATGGYKPEARILPQMMRITATGITAVPEEELQALYDEDFPSRAPGASG